MMYDTLLCRTRLGIFIVLATLVLQSCSVPASAQPFPTLTGELNEEYSANVSVSGVLIAGLWLGEPDAPLDPAEVYIRNSEQSTVIQTCFTATTRDGVYHSEGALTGSGKNATFFGVEPMKRSEFARQLRQYRSQDLALKAILATDCSGSVPSTYVPASLGSKSNTLLVAVNSRRALSIDVYFEREGSRIPSKCSRDAEIRSIAFDTICTFDFSKLVETGEWMLSVERIPRAGPRRIDDFTVRF